MRSKVVILVFLLSYALFVAGCVSSKAPEDIPSRPSIMTTSTAQPTDLTALTPDPSPLMQYPTATIDILRLPHLPITTPLPTHSYSMSPVWTEHHATYLLAQVRSNLESLADDPLYQGIYGQADYASLFDILTHLEDEAILRFPDSSRTPVWMWDRCYNLALVYPYANDPMAPELDCYKRLFEDAYQSGVPIDAFPAWFRSHESRIEISVQSYDPPQGMDAAYILELGGDGFEYQAVFILLEQQGEIKIYGIQSSLFYFRGLETTIQLVDLTGDRYPELLHSGWGNYCCGYFTFHSIYSLSEGHPRSLEFLNREGRSNSLRALDSGYVIPFDDGSGFIYKTNPHDPYTAPCTFVDSEEYIWIGDMFELSSYSTMLKPPGEYDDEELCNFALDHAKQPDEISVASQIFTGASVDDSLRKDQLLFRLGEYHARDGNHAMAMEYFGQLIDGPFSNDSGELVSAASQFMEGLNGNSTFYTLCLSIPACNENEALQALVRTIPPQDYFVLIEILRDSGVMISSSGSDDFLDNGSQVIWATVGERFSGTYGFWLFTKSDQDLSALFVGDISNPEPEIEIVYDALSLDGIPLVIVEGSSPFSLLYLQALGEFTIIHHGEPSMVEPGIQSQLFEEAIAEAWNHLAAGDDFNSIRNFVAPLVDSETLQCVYEYRCDEVLYILGLAYELKADWSKALSIYLHLWEQYPESLYSVAVRFKLNPPLFGDS